MTPQRTAVQVVLDSGWCGPRSSRRSTVSGCPTLSAPFAERVGLRFHFLSQVADSGRRVQPAAAGAPTGALRDRVGLSDGRRRQKRNHEAEPRGPIVAAERNFLQRRYLLATVITSRMISTIAPVLLFKMITSGPILRRQIDRWQPRGRLTSRSGGKGSTRFCRPGGRVPLPHPCRRHPAFPGCGNARWSGQSSLGSHPWRRMLGRAEGASQPKAGRSSVPKRLPFGTSRGT